ncbi:cytokine receptor common subunit beta-like [Carassius auratus]|uniref:Cytokine receptor common subunit beta-like n=1 Tax=Carassius auratus TaxID=7957 RepID=A0A6P6JZB0_CARAU|nr:cytokine receptor common subunit beta-like [Carassius auratus]XP_026065181.1 cytokine receptor common subunit beta-like [Carassius auratus]
MFSTWILHMVGFTLLVRGDISDEQCPPHEVTPVEESAVMESLQCHNDYMTYVQCTWEVDPHVHSQDTENMPKLYYGDYDDTVLEEETPCVSNRSSVLLPSGKISHTCRYNTDRFAIGADHVLYFKVPCVPKATTLRIADEGKVRAPIDLTETMTDNGGRLLSWRSQYPASSKITGTLVYQLQYRKDMDNWTIVDNISASEYMIDKESLSGYHYQARVRARGPVGLWSDWSPLLSWKTHNDGPFNLKCVIMEETTVTCTWQMKTEYYQFMSYHLWCSDNDNAELSACCKDPQLQSSGADLSEFVCSVNTSDPSLLTVELRPVYYTRTFYTEKHIKLSQPGPIHVEEVDGGFILNWTEPAVSEYIKYSIQIKISPFKTSESEILPMGQNYLNISSEFLDPSTEYQAQIRLLHVTDGVYDVQPSEWSEPAAFKTNPVSSPISFVIYILTPVFVAMLFIILYNTLPVLHRRITLWKGSIPSPIKSKVLEGMVKKSQSGWPNLQSENESTSICVLLAADNVSLCKSSVSSEPCLSHSEEAVKMAQSGGSDHMHAYVSESMRKEKSGMNFSGPYIMCCEQSCTQFKFPDSSIDKDHTCASGKSENFAPVNGGYVINLPTTMPATQNPVTVDSPTNNPSDEPPAYTPGPDQGCMVLPHPSGYFTMPCVVTD